LEKEQLEGGMEISYETLTKLSCLSNPFMVDLAKEEVYDHIDRNRYCPPEYRVHQVLGKPG